MPELPGPPDDASEEYRQAWLEGAATVAQLQADQWAIIAGKYREAVDDLDGEPETTTLEPNSEGGETDDGPAECPDCELDLVDGLGGTVVCPHCGASPSFENDD